MRLFRFCFSQMILDPNKHSPPVDRWQDYSLCSINTCTKAACIVFLCCCKSHINTTFTHKVNQQGSKKKKKKKRKPPTFSSSSRCWEGLSGSGIPCRDVERGWRQKEGEDERLGDETLFGLLAFQHLSLWHLHKYSCGCLCETDVPGDQSGTSISNQPILTRSVFYAPPSSRTEWPGRRANSLACLQLQHIILTK